MKPVLVTGATGGLGRVLIETLAEQGREALATGRNRHVGEALPARFLAADLATDDLAPLVEGVGAVFHLAALSSPWGPAAAFVAANVTATERLLAAARAAGCETFVYVSTPSIYARAADQLRLVETSPLPKRLANVYARTKYAAERAVLAADGRGFRTIALRPRAIIGPYDAVLLPRLLKAARRGVLALPRAGRALVEPTDARDVVAALLAAETRASQVGGQPFNLSGGKPIRFADLVTYVFALLERRVKIVSLPAPALLALGAALEALYRLAPGAPEPPITRYGAMTLGWSQTFDLEAAREWLGWAPRHDPHAAIEWALSRMNTCAK